MMMFRDHLQNWLVYGYSLLIFLILELFWLVYGYSLLIFLILELFWLSETGQILGFWAFPGERMEEMAWNFARWCILTTSQSD